MAATSRRVSIRGHRWAVARIPYMVGKRPSAAQQAAEEVRPSKEVFEKMEHARVITKRERKRLYKGDHV